MLLHALVLPDVGPQITGGRPIYQIDDQVNVNCTSGRSKPATDLMWFINGKEAPPAYLRYYEKQRSNDFDGLETTTLGLKFPVTVDSFNKGNMKLKVRHSDINSIRTKTLLQKSSFLFLSIFMLVFGNNRYGVLEKRWTKFGRWER